MSVFRHYCRGCGTFKPGGAFYASSPTKCKECVKAKVAAHRAANIERIREYDRSRAELPHRVEQNQRIAAQWRTNNPLRYAAQNTLNNALRDGKIVKLPCFVCGARSEAHHPDYSAPLAVVWLCPAHHKQAHAIAAAAMREEQKAA